MNNENKSLTEDDFLSILQEAATREGNHRALADKLQISTPYLCDILKKRRKIPWWVAEALGYRKRTAIFFEKNDGTVKTGSVNVIAPTESEA